MPPRWGSGGCAARSVPQGRCPWLLHVGPLAQTGRSCQTARSRSKPAHDEPSKSSPWSLTSVACRLPYSGSRGQSANCSTISCIDSGRCRTTHPLPGAVSRPGAARGPCELRSPTRAANRERPNPHRSAPASVRRFPAPAAGRLRSAGRGGHRRRPGPPAPAPDRWPKAARTARPGGRRRWAAACRIFDAALAAAGRARRKRRRSVRPWPDTTSGPPRPAPSGPGFRGPARRGGGARRCDRTARAVAKSRAACRAAPLCPTAWWCCCSRDIPSNSRRWFRR